MYIPTQLYLCVKCDTLHEDKLSAAACCTVEEVMDGGKCDNCGRLTDNAGYEKSKCGYCDD